MFVFLLIIVFFVEGVFGFIKGFFVIVEECGIFMVLLIFLFFGMIVFFMIVVEFVFF